MEMACEIMLRLTPQQTEGFTRLLALEAGNDADINAGFCALAGELGGPRAGAAADKLIQLLKEEGDSLYPEPVHERDGCLVCGHTFGSNGQYLAEALGDFFAAFEPPLSGAVEGDGDEDPYGFRYSFENGVVTAEEGFLMDELGEE